MGNISENSLFAIAMGSPATNDDQILTVLDHRRLPSLRYRRPSCSLSAWAPIAPTRDTDPYLLVLLADQEIEAQRPEQAESLIDAAYTAYDQCRFGS